MLPLFQSDIPRDVRCVVHIDTGAISVQTGVRVVEKFESICPVILYFGVEPI